MYHWVGWQWAQGGVGGGGSGAAEQTKPQPSPGRAPVVHVPEAQNVPLGLSEPVRLTWQYATQQGIASVAACPRPFSLGGVTRVLGFTD